MRQTLLPWQQREYKGMRTSSDALDLVALPEDLLIQCLDASMKLCTRAAMTSKEMRNALVKAAGKAKGLRMLAMYPQYALKAERAGLFRVQELVLSHVGLRVRQISHASSHGLMPCQCSPWFRCLQRISKERGLRATSDVAPAPRQPRQTDHGHLSRGHD